MTQTSLKLLEYMNSKPPGKIFTPQSVFLESGIDFGGQELIARAFDELECAGKVEQGNAYTGGRSYHLT
jgi:hypothetical protein